MRPTHRSAPGLSRPGIKAREQLIAAAGVVFAEKGFQGSTSREICQRAGANLAAVNYHFGGFEALYVATLKVAYERAVWIGASDVADFEDRPARDRLRAVLRNMVDRLSRSTADSWEMRLVAREMVVPTFAQAEFLTESIGRRRAFLKTIVAEMLNRPPDDPVVERSMLTVIAPCIVMSMVNRPALESLLPDLVSSRDGARLLVHHIERFVMAGLDAIAQDDSARAPTVQSDPYPASAK